MAEASEKPPLVVPCTFCEGDAAPAVAEVATPDADGGGGILEALPPAAAPPPPPPAIIAGAAAALRRGEEAPPFPPLRDGWLAWLEMTGTPLLANGAEPADAAEGGGSGGWGHDGDDDALQFSGRVDGGLVTRAAAVSGTEEAAGCSDEGAVEASARGRCCRCCACDVWCRGPGEPLRRLPPPPPLRPLPLRRRRSLGPPIPLAPRQ